LAGARLLLLFHCDRPVLVLDTFVNKLLDETHCSPFCVALLVHMFEDRLRLLLIILGLFENEPALNCTHDSLQNQSLASLLFLGRVALLPSLKIERYLFQ
jgi:hypothetical protein